MQEVLSRGDYHVRYPDHVAITVESACESIMVGSCENDTATLQASLSLAATVCKLLRHIAPMDTAESKQARQREFAEQPAALMEWLMQRVGTLDSANTFVSGLILAVSALCRVHAPDNFTPGGASGDGGVGNSSSIDSGSSSIDNCSSSGSGGNHSGARDVSGRSGGSSKPANDDRVGCAAANPSSSEVHRLQTVTCLTLVQVFRWASALPCLPSKEGWWVYALRACDELPWQGLRGLVTALLEESSLRIAQAEVNIMWERYAVENFQGRLLPGCCHQGCTNLTGVSEAALKTLLCGGCRKARYCCLECQKAAWLEGGHRLVCRK